MPPPKHARWIKRGPCRLRLVLQSGVSLFVDVEGWQYRPESTPTEWHIFPAQDSPDWALFENVVAIQEVVR